MVLHASELICRKDELWYAPPWRRALQMQFAREAMRVVGRVARGSALWRGRPRGLATAAVCTKLGAPLELQHDWRLPPLGPTDVRVRIAAAGINYADLLQACA